MKMQIGKSVILGALAFTVGCGETLLINPVNQTNDDDGNHVAPTAELCPNGDSYPFDKCGKDLWKPLPLEPFPRELPQFVNKLSHTKLSKNDDLTELLAGEWIGTFWPVDGEMIDIWRMHLLFGKDYTFRASVFQNTRGKNQTIQDFDMAFGTYSEVDGMLLLQLAEPDKRFSGAFHGFTWRTGGLQQLIIPIGLHEDGKTLTLRENMQKKRVISVFVKKES